MTEKIDLFSHVKKITLDDYIKKSDNNSEKESLDNWLKRNDDNYEKNQISSIEDEYKKFKSEWKNHIAYATSHFVTTQEILGMLNRTKEYEKYFLSLENVAQYLDYKRRFAFSKKLNEIIKDVRDHIRTCSEVYQSKLDNEKQVASIRNDVRSYTTNTLRESTTYAQQSNDKLNKIFTAQLTDSCVCGEHLGDKYYRLEICPACGRYLHKQSF